MIKKIIAWYLKKHNQEFEYNGYVICMVQKGYYHKLKQYAGWMEGVNCRHYCYPIIKKI